MAIAAREASNRGLLTAALTAVYPTSTVRRRLGRLGLAERGRIARLLERDEGIPDELVHALLAPELLDEALRLTQRLPGVGRAYPWLVTAMMRLYGRSAARELGRLEPARIFHYRAGFGQTSVARARRLGLVALCDHTAAHPATLDGLIDGRGALPAPVARPREPFARAILADIDAADAVLVNSDFVKRTFLDAGWAPERVHVAYLGVDDNFLRALPQRREDVAGGPVELLYAGRLERGKGAEVLIEALTQLDGWQLWIAGPVAPEIEAGHREFLRDPRVRLLGTLRRPELARKMASVRTFVFPSYAEGSARVVFEALACGCYVITTPNSGSIVADGEHGALVPAGDAEALASAIAAAGADRERTAAIGDRNAELVRTRYRQADYGDALASLYARLVPA